MRRRGRPLAVVAVLAVIAVLAVLACAPDDAVAHTKGLTLSRFGLIDASLQSNVDYLTFDDPKRVDFDKIGDRDQKGFKLTSFDLSLIGQLPEFPLKFAMFLTFEQDKASIEEAFHFFHKLGKLSPALSDFQVRAGLSTSSAASGATGKRRPLVCRPWGLA